MYHNIFDTHSHYDDSKFDPDREELLNNLQSQGVSLVVSCGCDIDSTQFNFDLAQKYDYMYFAAGFHPENLKGATLEDLKVIEKFAKNNKCVAIGEIGLDYHYDNTDKPTQKYWFSRQLELAKEKIKKLQELAENVSADDCHELMFAYELKERLTVCITLIEHLKARKETRWHSFDENLDYPEKSDEWLKYVNSKKVDGEIKIITRQLVGRGESYEHNN